MSEFNLKPVDNQTAEYIINRCWNDFYMKYAEYDTFTNETFDEIIGHVDKTGVFQKGLIDRLYGEMPCEFTSNICLAILMELEARDRGEYIDIYHGHDEFEGSHVLSKVDALIDRENCWL